MAQLKMYRFAGTPYTVHPLPEGYTVSNYQDENDIMPWVHCCQNGMLKEDAGPEAFEKRITARAPYLNPYKDLFFLDYGGEHVATITAYKNENGIGDVHMVAVRSDFRGRGLSNILSDIALRHLDEDLKVPYSYLTTDEWRVAAVKSYLTAGFLPVDYDAGMPERWEKILETYGIGSIPMLTNGAKPYRTVRRSGLAVKKANAGALRFCMTNRNMPSDAYHILYNVAKRKFADRGLSLSDDPETDYEIVLDRTSSAKYNGDRYTVIPGDGRVVLTAGNSRTLFAAFGRWLEESFADGKGNFFPCRESIDFTPKAPLRGMYFATHFHNFYHNAPLPKVYEIIEDLALRGCNSLLVWFDMHHFDSMEDPGAVELTERLRAILHYANRMGVGGSLTMLANEAFKSSPEALRAEWWVQNGYTRLPEDHYHVEICPSRKGGIEEILRERRAMLEKFADLKIDYISYWPYDQGGCTCKDCAPWGSNGFMKLYPHFRDLVKEVMPDTRVILSTWYFDKFVPGEWDAFYAQIRDGLPEGAEYVMSFFFHGKMPEVIEKNGLPENVKFIDFPEISMFSCTPWGGFGASALPRFLGTTNENSGHLYSGGFPYSEGIFEDVNKYISLSYYTGEFDDANAAVRSYVRHEFCVEGRALDELTEAIVRSENVLARKKDKTATPVRFVMERTADADYVYKIFSRYDRILPESIRTGWKFRIWYLRAVIDRELVSNDFYPLRSEICQKAMRELCDIYSATEETWRWVKPPVGM